MDYKVPPTVSTAEFFASDRGYAFLVSETAVAAFVLDEWSFTILQLLRDHPYGEIENLLSAYLTEDSENPTLLSDSSLKQTIQHLMKLNLLTEIKHAHDSKIP